MPARSLKRMNLYDAERKMVTLEHIPAEWISAEFCESMARFPKARAARF